MCDVRHFASLGFTPIIDLEPLKRLLQCRDVLPVSLACLGQ
jgi:hypothetical protein